MAELATRDIALARLVEARQRLAAEYDRDSGGLAHARALATTLDESLRSLVAGLPAGADWAVLAVGGYGRGEVAPHSDVDLLILSRRGNQGAERVATELSYALWDAKLEASPRVHELPEALRVPVDDFARVTSYLQGRYLAGDAALAAEFSRRFLEHLRRDGGRDFLRRLRAEEEERHATTSDTAHSLEPDLKEGHGGLRDAQAILWAGRVGLGVGATPGLVLAGYLAEDEAEELESAAEALWLLRHRLHYAAGRRADHLHLAYQEELAAFLGASGHNGHTPVETMMRALNAHGAAVVRAAAAFWEHVEDELLAPRGRAWRWLPGPSTAAKSGRATAEPWLTHAGRLELTEGAAAPATAMATLAAFAVAASRQLALGHGLLRATRTALSQDQAPVEWDESTRGLFLAVLRAGENAPVLLEQLAETGVLERLLPEWRDIRYLARQDVYHSHTVDRHSALVVRELNRLAAGEGVEGALGARLAAEVSDFDLLLLAGLVHDLGKGRAGDHTQSGAALALTIGERLGLAPAQGETLAFLVREHLTLARAATRRDLEDARLVRQLARLVGNAERLRLLYLLTVADSVATGPSAWSEWKGSLLRELFFRLLRTLDGSEALADQAAVAEKRERLRQELSRAAGEEAAGAFVDSMPEAYILSQQPEAAGRHLALLASKQSAVGVDVRPADDRACHELTLAAPDRPGLLWRVCGVFALHGLSVLEARIFTDARGQALDIFRLVDTFEDAVPEGKWEVVRRDLALVLAGRLALAYRLARKLRPYAKKSAAPSRPTQLTIDNTSSAEATIVEIHAQDRLGLLYTIARAFDELGLTIELAKVATRGPEAIDAFYVRDRDGSKVTDTEQLQELERAVLFELERGDH